jgi:dienelactone hydrolase
MRTTNVRTNLSRALLETIRFSHLQLFAASMLFFTVLVVNAAPQAPPQQDPEALARAFVEEMVAGKFEQAAARFDETVGKLMPAAKLAETWQGVQGQAGAFQKITGTTRRDAQGYRIVLVTCLFASTSLNVQVAFDATDHIAGLHFAPVQPPAPPWSPAASVKQDAFEERDVTIGNAPWALPGKLTVPKGAGPFPAVVLVHGSGPNDADETIGANKPFKDLAWGLASRGIAVLRYMKRTRQYPQQMAALPGITVKEETVEDAVHAVELLEKQPGIDPKRIYIVGHSLGAMLAPRIAAADKSIAGIIVMAGTTRSLDEVVVEQVKYMSNFDGKVTEAEQKQIDAAEQFAREVGSPELTATQPVHMLGTTIPGSYFLDLRSYHAGEVATALNIPILVLQGERDYQVRMTDFEGWRKALGNRRMAMLKSYPSLNHLFIAGSGPGSPAEYSQPGHVAEEVLQDIADWILARGKPAASPQPHK